MVTKEKQLNVGDIKVTRAHLISTSLGSRLLNGRGEIIFCLFPHWLFSVEMLCPVLAATIQTGCQKMGYRSKKICKNRDSEDASVKDLGR